MPSPDTQSMMSWINNWVLMLEEGQFRLGEVNDSGVYLWIGFPIMHLEPPNIIELTDWSRFLVGPSSDRWEYHNQYNSLVLKIGKAEALKAIMTLKRVAVEY